MKTFSEWLQANGYDEANLTERDRKHLTLAWKSECQDQAEKEKGDREKEKKAARDEDHSPGAEEGEFELAAREIRSENARRDEIRSAALLALKENEGSTGKCEQIQTLAEKALSDKKTTAKDFKLSLLYAVRDIGPMVLTPREQPVTENVLEAALCVAGGLETVEKQYDARTLEAAHRQFRGGAGLSTIVTICARANGFRGHDFKSNWHGAVRAAFGGSRGDGMDVTPMAATTAPSTMSLPNILSNVANKFLRVGFEAVDDTWRRISARRSFNDFKQTTEITLTGSLMYKQVPPSGELKHGTLGELTYVNQAKTYGTLLGIDRQALINDDLGALTGAGRRLGRGGALKLNDVFWTVFLNNSSFFTAGNNNVETTAAALSLTTLGAADTKFRQQTDPDGLPMSIMPKILLVPPGNRINAMTFMNSTLLAGTATTPTGITNVLAGAYQVESSPYMANSAYTGYSTTASYLLADPNDVPVIEVGFLNGQESPIVETEAAEFNMLGIALRGYWDLGVALVEYRGGVRISGA